jgi:hypothetical protein
VNLEYSLDEKISFLIEEKDKKAPQHENGSISRPDIEMEFHVFIFSAQPVGCWFLIVTCPPDRTGRESPMIIRAGCTPVRGDFIGF